MTFQRWTHDFPRRKGREMKRQYSLTTEKLIQRQCRNVKREDFILEKKKAEELILKTYDLFNLPRPKKIAWYRDIFDKKFARSARSSWSARSARSAWSARSVGSAGSARSEWSARIDFTALDYDFDWYIFEFEYCQNPDKRYPVNQNDRIYLEYCELLMQAKEAGLGYRVEWEDTLYLVPTPIVRIDTQNRFHSLTEPAIRWKGGKEFYYISGVNIEKSLFTKIKTKKLTKRDWLNQENVEIRRIIQEQMGSSFPQKIGCKLIDKPSKEFKKHNLLGLYEVDLPNDPDKIAHYVKVKDHSTNREFYLRTPKDINSADESLSWTFGKTKKTYNPIIET